MVFVITTEYFISINGPYFAKDNDASILNHAMKSNIEDIRSWIQDDDVFIVDRGVRDSITYLQDLTLYALTPIYSFSPCPRVKTYNPGDIKISVEEFLVNNKSLFIQMC